MGAFAVKRGVLACPGDLEIAGLAVVLASLAAAGLAPPREPWVKAGAPAAWRLPGAARTNELDAGERRPMIAERGGACRLWLPGGFAEAPGGVRGPAERVSHPPIRPPAWAGP